MVDLKKRTMLVIAPHPDDEVIGCGGLIRKVKAEGGKVYVLFLAVARSKDFSTLGRSTAKERLEEIERVADYLDFDGWRVVFKGEDFHLNLDQVSQKKIIHVIERGGDISLEVLQPDIIAFPLFDDYNQDHRAAAEAAFAACRPAPTTEKHVPPVILSYEAPMSSWVHSLNHSPQPNLYIDMLPEDAEAKIHAMSLYSSQLRGNYHPRNLETLRAFAQVRGSAIGAAFAEAFVCHKMAVH